MFSGGRGAFPYGEKGGKAAEPKVGDMSPEELRKAMGRDQRAPSGGGARVLPTSAAEAALEGRCYSLHKPKLCPRKTKDDSRTTPDGSECTDPTEDHADAKRAVRFCGTRLARANPCWADGAGVACLPHFFLQGEMKCGTTSLYKKLAQHPHVELPRNKEVRYLQSTKYKKHSGTWYADNFKAVVGRADAVTFDASPTTFSSIELAPGWVHKWLPQAKHIIMLRDPVQRTYSHYRMGKMWLEVSACYERGEVPGTRVPSAQMAGMVLDEGTFPAQVRLGVAQAVLKECGGTLPWGKPGGPFVQSNTTVDCLRRHEMGRYVIEVWNAWQERAYARSKEDAKAYAAASRRLSICSEMMLRPGGGMIRSSKYAANLRVWKASVPAAQLKVVITEDLERSPDRVVKEVLEFLGLDYSLLPAGPTHNCVVGKAGIMDEAADAGKKDSGGQGLVVNKAGVFGTGTGLGITGAGGDAATKSIAIGECTSDGLKQVDPASKRAYKKYKMDREAERTLQRFFAPYNKQLVQVLGYDPGWS